MYYVTRNTSTGFPTNAVSEDLLRNQLGIIVYKILSCTFHYKKPQFQILA